MKKNSDYAKIMQVLEAKGISVSKAEAMAGLGVSTISKLKQRKGGHGGLHEDNLRKFLRTFHVKTEWWETEEGEMFTPGTDRPRSEATKTMDLDVWEVIKGSNKIFELEFDRLWRLIERFAPPPAPPSKTKEKITNGES